MGAIKAAILELLRHNHPMGVRQIYYRIESMGLVPKTEVSVKAVIGRLLREMRRSGEIPYAWISDFSRRPILPLMFEDVPDAVRWLRGVFRHDYWKDQPTSIQVWLEKGSLEGIFAPITRKYGVPLYPTHGNSSLSFLHDAAGVIAEQERPVIVYQFGDRDWSGHNINEVSERDIREWVEEINPNADLTFERVAVTESQIREFGLPTRPGKKDVRATDWVGDCVELDALEPRILVELLEGCIRRSIDWAAWERSEREEAADRKKLTKLLGGKA